MFFNNAKKIGLSKFQAILLAVFCVATVVLFTYSFLHEKVDITIRGQNLHLLVAKTPAQQFKGLSDRESLGKYDGMLFYFSIPKQAGIVMRDMRFPIDILWIDSKLKIVDMVTNVAPEPGKKEAELRVYYPRTEVSFVLEVPAGFVEKNGVVLGDTIGLSAKP